MVLSWMLLCSLLPQPAPPFWVLPFAMTPATLSAHVADGAPRVLYQREDWLPRLDELRRTFGRNKEIPPRYELETLLALSHFPALKDTRIRFVTRSRAPISSRPFVWTLLRGRKSLRVYRIGIDESDRFGNSPALLKNMSFNARVGALGHEIAHTDYYETKRWYQFIAIGASFVSRKFHKKFERDTDQRTIEAGLGHQLWLWAREIRGGRVTDNPNSWLDRYYYAPSVIAEQMARLAAYQRLPTPQEALEDEAVR
ncbi:hypothetical protein [Acanthopleuribacter pedis]|uniref:Uncharacterized protein n=1 Tax=Acanthopleuribacter pedis TaxID=442870 RepID=A0A8J7PZH8_9BACT|nr:hypothetical protein [Acanthopleuribacter pedis]MBO1317587.1 hypothetical protein [Acanthopleuribacter pedis]